ncbi:MAG: mannose-1-phosphate guanylyltransferase, partial [Anaerolineaceae bacterium]
MNYAVILAGGAGTRLWPLSRERLPKTALRFYSDQSMFQIAVARLAPLFTPEQIIVVAGRDHALVLSQQVPEIPADNFVIEPEGRNTAPAIGLAAIHLAARDPEACMAVLTADHHIGDTETFRRSISAALEVAKDDYLVTLGITPTEPSTQFGYIEQGQELASVDGFRVFRTERFIEKPQQERAEDMLEQGNYTWNSGMFMWKVSAIMQEFRHQMPALYEALLRIGAALGASFKASQVHPEVTITDPEAAARAEYERVLAEVWPSISKQSIDYGVMEMARKVAVIPVDMAWLDIGNWNSMKTLFDQDQAGNAVRGDTLLLDSRDLMVVGGKRLIAVIGLEDLAIIDSDDALLICRKDRVGDVRKIVAQLKDSG